MITLAHSKDISLNCINGLHPGFKERVQAWYNQMFNLGLKPYIYEGYRSEARQAVLFAQGRTTPGKIVTKAEPGQSFHNYGLAFDYVPLITSDKASDMFEADWDNVDVYSKGLELGRTICFRSLSWETPHLEDAGYADWRDAKQRLGSDDYQSWRS